MKHVYLISGLGADYRMFQHLDLSAYNTTHVKWLPPGADEHIEHYAKRLAETITDPKPIIIGLSFGGMIAIEMGKHITVEHIILLSSVKTKHDLPFYFRLTGYIGLHRILPLIKMKQPNLLNDYLFGAHTKEERTLLAQIIRDTDDNFYKWAVDKILRWQNITIPASLFHIHGNADFVLPYLSLKHVDFTIKGGTHYMTLNRANEISSLLNMIIG